jgi:aryl-alcohol dehydrogenase-like predicted oxidoreductase
METRFLGSSGLEVSCLGFGAMTFGEGDGRFSVVGTTTGDAARRQVDMCLEAGVNLFDTADVYAEGRSEEVLGAALGSRRKDVIIATKAFGRTGPAAHDSGLSRRHLVEACEASLRRLGSDWIDLYQIHGFDALVPLEETLRALDDLVRSGKVRYVGCSNLSGWHLMKAGALAVQHRTERFVSQQIQYSLLLRDAEHELLPCGLDQGVGALIWGPLASGYLSGKYRASLSGDEATRLGATGRLNQFDDERGRKVVDTLFSIAAAHDGASPSQVALNWLLKRAGVTSVLVGARRDEQLADNLAAARWSLSDDEMEVLDRVSQLPLPYPNSHHRIYSSDRNPELFPRWKSPA